MTDIPRVFLAAYHDGLSPRYEVVPEGAMGAEPWVPEGAGVRVKPLEFLRDESGLITEDARYIIAQTFGEWRVWFHSDPLRDARGRPISYDGEPQAVSAANAHHEARIRAALELTTEPEREPVEWTPPHDREDGYRCLGWYGGQWNPVNWRSYQDYSEWTDDEWMDFSPEAFAPMPSNPGERPTSGAFDLICCTAEDVVRGRGFTGDAAADLATARESLRDCLKLLGWRG